MEQRQPSKCTFEFHFDFVNVVTYLAFLNDTFTFYFLNTKLRYHNSRIHGITMLWKLKKIVSLYQDKADFFIIVFLLHVI